MVAPSEAVVAIHVARTRRPIRTAAAAKRAKNTKSLAPICATASVPGGWNASVNAPSTCWWCRTIAWVGPAATL